MSFNSAGILQVRTAQLDRFVAVHVRLSWWGTVLPSISSQFLPGCWKSKHSASIICFQENRRPNHATSMFVLSTCRFPRRKRSWWNKSVASKWSARHWKQKQVGQSGLAKRTAGLKWSIYAVKPIHWCLCNSRRWTGWRWGVCAYIQYGLEVSKDVTLHKTSVARISLHTGLRGVMRLQWACMFKQFQRSQSSFYAQNMKVEQSTYSFSHGTNNLFGRLSPIFVSYLSWTEVSEAAVCCLVSNIFKLPPRESWVKETAKETMHCVQESLQKAQKQFQELEMQSSSKAASLQEQCEKNTQVLWLTCSSALLPHLPRMYWQLLISLQFSFRQPG